MRRLLPLVAILLVARAEDRGGGQTDARPAPDSNVTVDGAAPRAVDDEDALLACTGAPCMLAEGARVRVALSAAMARVVVAP